jgi:type 1 glutamine amidotransferase
VHDERYHDLLVAPDVTSHVLATATLEGRTEPIAWAVLSPRGGRVFHITLGHDGTTYINPAFVRLIHQGLVWVIAAEAAGGEDVE